jgi:hypothetical protein
VRERGLRSHVTMAGYVEADADLTDHIAACDVSINLRWPTAREMSGPWLRALAAGLPTISTDLAHLADVPSLDPRTWTTREPRTEALRGQGRPEARRGANGDAVTIAVDILDEDHSLRLAMRRLAMDAALRQTLGASARAYWEDEHSMPRMLEDYRRVIVAAAAAPIPRPALPAHLVNHGDATLRTLLEPFNLDGARCFDR